jgi:hypothetical protein
MASLVCESHTFLRRPARRVPPPRKKTRPHVCPSYSLCHWQQTPATCWLLSCVVPAYAGVRVSPWTRATRWRSMCWRRSRRSPRSATCSPCAPLCPMHALAPAYAAGGGHLPTLAPLARACACARASVALRPACLVRVRPCVCNLLTLVQERNEGTTCCGMWTERTDLLHARNRRLRCVVIHLMPARNNLAH